MKDLTARLDALDPDAGAALRVVTYFDELVGNRAGLQAIVRAAVLLTGSPAALVDDVRGIRIRVDEQGHVGDPEVGPDPRWPVHPLDPDGGLVWLERTEPPRPVDAVTVERAAAAARAVLDRTRGRHPASAGDHGSLEVLLDPAADRGARLTAARRLGLTDTTAVHVVALSDGRVMVRSAPAPGTAADDVPAHVRAGVGPDGSLDDLPASHRAARLALRFTAEGTPLDPGPRVVHADRLGGLALLAEVAGPDAPPVQDVLALDRAAATGPWALATLEALVTTTSLRAAAVALTVHHSTLQERSAALERVLGWKVTDPAGRLRLQLALVLRRLRRNPADGAGPRQ